MGNFDSSDDATAPTKMLGRKKSTPAPAAAASTKKIGERGIGDIQEDKPILPDQETVGGANFYSETSPGVPASPVTPAGSDQNTVVFRPTSKAAPQQAAVAAPVAPLARTQAEVEAKPVIGWLVIVKGPGKGSGLELTYGKLQIGRDQGQDVPINFGDNGITRANHAAVEYDKKTRKFYLYKGENLIYLNGERVGMGSEEVLTTGDEIELSDETTLRFVSFCGPKFDWNE